MVRRLLCALRGHPDQSGIRTEAIYENDYHAGTGFAAMSGWCTVCRKRVYWRQAIP